MVPAQAQRRIRKQKIIIIATASILLIVVLGWLNVDRIKAVLPVSAKPEVSAVPESAFIFDASLAPDWYEGPGNETSKAAFRNGGNCFVMMVVEKGAMNKPALIQKWRDSVTERGLSSTYGEDLPLVLNGENVSVEYTLLQRTNDTSTNPSNVFEYEAVGYAPLERGYLRVEAYCNHVDGLSEPSQALKAFVLK